MKRIVILFTAVALSLILSMSITGCVFGGLIFDSDTSVAAKKLDSLIECIEKKDSEGLKALFAPNKLADIDDFDESIQELFDYYGGEFVSHPNSTPGSMKDSDYGTVKEYFLIRNEVYTTEDTYYFTIYWYIRDDTDRGNEGIWSLDVLKSEDSPADNDSYCYIGWKDSEFQSSRDNGEKVIFHNFGHNEVTTKYSYDFAFRWCSRDTADEGNVGLWSVYVKRYEYDEETYSETLRTPYWGDGLWTKGINIGVF